MSSRSWGCVADLSLASRIPSPVCISFGGCHCSYDIAHLSATYLGGSVGLTPQGGSTKHGLGISPAPSQTTVGAQGRTMCCGSVAMAVFWVTWCVLLWYASLAATITPDLIAPLSAVGRHHRLMPCSRTAIRTRCLRWNCNTDSLSAVVPQHGLNACGRTATLTHCLQLYCNTDSLSAVEPQH